MSPASVTAVLKYLVIKTKKDDFAQGSPFLIKRATTDCAGSAVLDIRKAAAGSTDFEAVHAAENGGHRLDIVPHASEHHRGGGSLQRSP